MDGNVTDRRHCLVKSLCDNTDQVVTICTEACCHTGLLCSVTHDVVKLITRKNYGCPGNNCYGKVTFIPICEISSLTLCNTSV
jgi:hypothetical protein